MEDKKPHYKRILVKLSGEALSAGDKGILNYDFLEEVGNVIKTWTLAITANSLRWLVLLWICRLSTNRMSHR